MKEIRYCIVKIPSGEVILNQITSSELAQVSSKDLKNGAIESIKIGGNQAKFHKICNGMYEISCISYSADVLKSSKIIRNQALLMLELAPRLENDLKIIKEQATDHAQRLIHNLKSLTAKITQEVYYIALQHELIKNPKQSIEFTEKQVKQNPLEAAQALIKILKYATAQKTEFSAFQKLNGNIEGIKKECHSVHKVLMNILYLFFQDFTDKGVFVSLEKSDAHAFFDYESVHVCIFHIIENATKYIKQHTPLDIYIKQENNETSITFDMTSLTIQPGEEEKIFLEGFSGHAAIQSMRNGSGIGLYISRKMSELNDGSLRLINNKPTQPIEYSRNKFILTLSNKK